MGEDAEVIGSGKANTGIAMIDAECGVRGGGGVGFQIVDCGLWIVDCGSWAALSSIFYLLSSIFDPLSPIHYLRSTISDPLSTISLRAVPVAGFLPDP
jgi:hypothetical protein